jgi:hypothetical protein
MLRTNLIKVGYYDPVVAVKVRQQFVNRGILEPLQAVAGD